MKSGFKLDSLSELYRAALREHLSPQFLATARWQTYGKGIRVYAPYSSRSFYLVHHGDPLHVHFASRPVNLDYCCC